LTFLKLEWVKAGEAN